MCISRCSSCTRLYNCGSYSAHSIPSTPAAASRFSSWKPSTRSCGVMWWSRAVNRQRLSLLALSCTPSSPFDAISRLCVRLAGVSSAFPLTRFLSSIASAAPALFGNFFGTTSLSDFSPTWVTALRLAAFSVPPCSGSISQGIDEISQLPCKRFPDMRRVCDREGSRHDLRISPCFVWPSAFAHSVGIPNSLISRLNGWPAVSPVNASACVSRRLPHDSGSG